MELTTLSHKEGLSDGHVSGMSHSSPHSIEWEASEYIHHEKGVVWVLLLVLASVALIATAVLLAQWSLVVVLVTMMITLGLYALRRPKTLRYKLDSSTLTVEDKKYPLTSFKAFGVVEEGAFHSVHLIPVKRFNLVRVLYVSERMGETIVDILGSQLPLIEIAADPAEQLMRKLRF